MGPLISREELFTCMDYKIPGLAEVKKHVDQKDYPAAEKSLLEYMRSRRNVKYFVNSWEKPAAKNAKFNTAVADDVCNHIFHGLLVDWYPPYKMGEKIDWAAEPYNDREWYWGLNRLPFWIFLGEAYWATQNEKYAKEFVEELFDWVRNCPIVTDGAHNESPAWRTLEAGIRMYDSWPAAYQYFLNSPNFTPEANTLFLMSVIEHARFLEKNPTSGNWLVMERNGLLHVGLLFPELKESTGWRNAAIDTLTRELGSQVYPDGSQFELTTTYHRVCIMNFLKSLQLCELNSVSVSDKYKKDLQNLYQAVMYLLKPSGYLPALNDSDAYIETIKDKGEFSDGRGDLREGAKRFSRPDMLYVATNGKEGKAPEYKSYAFLYAGRYVMRQGWDKDAMYMIFDAGPFGAAHQHEDKLSIETYAYGETLLFDSGRFSYADPIFHPYAFSTTAHNTAIIDGKDQSRRFQSVTERKWVVSEPQKTPWISQSGFDYAEGVYDDGYGPDLDKSVTHSRKILFVKNDYWIVLDRFEGQGTHKINTFFHFAPGKASVNNQTLECVTVNSGRPNISILPSDSKNTKVSIAEGSKSPCQGWISTEYNKYFPAPVADYEYTGPLPLERAYLLHPLRLMQKSELKLEKMPVTVDDKRPDPKVSAYAVKLEDGFTDYILFAHSVLGTKRFGGIITDAQIAIVRVDTFGSVLKASAYGAAYLRHGAQDIPLVD